MRTPAIAVLWESWRLSRRSLLNVVLFSTLGGAAIIIGSGPEDAGWAILLAAFMALLGRAWADNVDRRTGFTMRLGFTRPIHTAVLVGVPMAYIAVSTALVYLLPVLALGSAFGLSFPLFPAAAALATLNLVLLTSQLWTRDAVLRIAGRVLIMVPVVVRYLAGRNPGSTLALDSWSERFALDAADYAAMSGVAATAFALTVFGVARQRRGDDLGMFLQQRVRTAGAVARWPLISRLVNAVTVPCPVSSPTSAQLWFEVRTSGLRILKSGAFTALAIVTVSALVTVTAPRNSLFLTAEAGSYAAVLALYTLSVPIIAACRSILGARRKQGVADLSAFDRTRPLGTATLVNVKVGVTSLALLAAWAAIWVAVSLAAWPHPVARQGLDEYGLGPSAPETAALMLIPIPVALAYVATLHALLLLNARRVVATAVGVGVYLVTLIYALASGWATNAAITVHIVVVAGAAGLALVQLLRHTLADHTVTPRYVAMAFAAALGFAFSVVLGGGNSVISSADAFSMFFLFVLGLLGMVLAPWSFNRVRHR